MKVLGDPGTGLLPAGIGGAGTADRSADAGDGGDPARGAGARRGRDGLRQRVYARRADRRRSSGCSRSPAKAACSAHIHMRGGVPGLRETIAAAANAHAPLHIVHVNSSAGDDLDEFLTLIKAARDGRPGRHDRSLSVRRGHDRDPVRAVRRLGDWPDESSGSINSCPPANG